VAAAVKVASPGPNSRKAENSRSVRARVSPAIALDLPSSGVPI